MRDDTFARIVSLACHDVRTPLATVHGFATTLVRRYDLGDPAARYVALIETASAQIGDLIDDLSLAARIESGRYEPAVHEVDTLALAQTAAAKLGTDRTEVSGPGGAARGDQQGLERALAGLARCALRHGGLDSVALSADGTSVTIGPVTADVAPIVLGDDLRDLGAAVGVRVVRAGGGSVEIDGDRLVVRLPGG